MDNTEDTALNVPAGEETSQSTTPVDEPKTPETETLPEGETEPTGEEQPKEDAEVKEVPKKSAEGRIRELAAKAKAEKERADSLASKVEEFTRGITQPGPQAPYQPQVKPGEEITPEQYHSDVTKTADALVQLRLNQYKIVENINKEAYEAVKKYPELDNDPNNEHFNKELSDSITEATMAYVRSNPTGSVKKFVDKLMRPYKQALTKEVAKETETVNRQVSQTALRPTPSTKTEKKFEDLSPKEMEAKLGVVY